MANLITALSSGPTATEQASADYAGVKTQAERNKIAAAASIQDIFDQVYNPKDTTITTEAPRPSADMQGPMPVTTKTVPHAAPEQLIRQNLPKLAGALANADQYGQIGNLFRAFVGNTPDLKDTGMIDRSMLGAGDAYSSTIGGFREGEANKMARTKAAADRMAGGGKPPSGYRWTEDGQGLEPIPGGPAEKLTPEQAGKIALAESSTDFMPDVKTALVDPKMLNPIATAFEIGETGEGYRKLDMALDAYVRATTGATMNKEELRNVYGQFYPRSYDSRKTRQQKFDSLTSFLTKYQTGLRKGRGGGADVPVAPEIDGDYTIELVE